MARPFDDLDVNSVGTLNRQVVKMSTNKGYGKRANTIRLKELLTRWDYDRRRLRQRNSLPVPHRQEQEQYLCAAKVAADVIAQEYEFGISA